MSKEEEYNKLIADKLNARSFESSEQDWNDALDLIEAHDKKKKRRFLFWIIPSAGLLITGALWIALSPSQTNDPTELAQVKKETEKLIVQTEQNQNKEQIRSELADENNNNVAIKKLAELNESVNAEQKNKISSVVDQNKAVKKNRSTENSIETPSENNNSKENKNNKKVAITKKRSNTKTTTVSKISKQKEETVKELSKPKKDEGKTEEIRIAADPPKTKESDSEITVASFQTKTTSETPLLNSALNDTTTTEKKETLPELKNTITKVDSAIKTEKFLDPILPPSSRFEFYALGSLQYTSVKDPSQKLLDKLNPMGGLYFVRSFVNGTGFGSGLFYSVYSANTLSPKTYKSVSQEFGYKALVTEISPDKFHYGRIPVFATYSFKKNRIFFGVQASYMLICRSIVSSYNESYKTISDQKTERTFGYTNGINKFDVSLMCAYSRPIYQKFGLGIGMDYGFKDTKDNAYFGSKAIERNMSFQLFINYKIR